MAIYECPKKLLTIVEAAFRAGISRSFAYKLVNLGEWPVVKIGAATRVPLADLDQWIEEQARAANEEAERKRDLRG